MVYFEVVYMILSIWYGIQMYTVRVKRSPQGATSSHVWLCSSDNILTI